jgi:hypothetical protein
VQALSIKTYLSESLYNTPEMQAHWKRIDEGFVSGYEKYLSEVALTPDQIQGIFTQASAGGAGAAPKEPGKLAAIFDKILPSSQAANLEKSLPEPNAGPVDGFENKAAAAVQGLQGVDGGTKQSLMQLVKAGIKKPETQQLILAAVGAGLGGLISKVGPFLSMIPGGGPVVAAITGAVVAGGVAVIAAKLRGEDWKSAFKGAIKPALMGGAAAVVGNLVTTGISAMMSGGSSGADATTGSEKGSPEQQQGLASDQKFQDRMLNKFPPDQGYTFGANGNSLEVFDAGGRKVFTGDIPLKTMDMKQFADLTNNGQMATPGISSSSVASDPMAGVSGKGSAFDNDPDVQAHRAEVAAMKADAARIPTDTVTNPDGSITQSGSGTVRGEVPAGATATDNAGSYVLNKTNPDGSSSQTVRQNADPADPRVMANILAKQDYYKNDPQGQAEYAKIMKGGTKGIDDGRIPTGKKLSEGQVYLVINKICQHKLNEGPLDAIKGMFGKSKAAPATAVTADALNAAWKQAGSPTDSDEIAAILKQAGVGDDVVGKVYTDLKIPAPGAKPAAAAVDIEQVKKIIATLPVDRKVRLLKFMQKNTAAAPAQG